MGFTVLSLRPKPDHWGDIHAGMVADRVRINAIIRDTDPTLLPVCFDTPAMLSAAIQRTVEDNCRAIHIRPDVGLTHHDGDDDWPIIGAGMTDTQAVHFKLAYSDLYEIEQLPYGDD